MDLPGGIFNKFCRGGERFTVVCHCAMLPLPLWQWRQGGNVTSDAG